AGVERLAGGIAAELSAVVADRHAGLAAELGPVAQLTGIDHAVATLGHPARAGVEVEAVGHTRERAAGKAERQAGLAGEVDPIAGLGAIDQAIAAQIIGVAVARVGVARRSVTVTRVAGLRITVAVAERHVGTRGGG